MTEQRKIPAVDAFWKAALGDNSRMANLAKSAITELQACLAAQPAPQRVAVPEGYAVFNVGALEAILYQNCPALRIKDADMAKAEMKRVLSGAMLAKGDV